MNSVTLMGRVGKQPERENSFWSKVSIGNSPMECWEWIGARDVRGYGNVFFAGKHIKAHRVAWELHNFKIPEGFIVIHLCDNPSCCNPNHLAIASNKANTFDMMKKGRAGFGKVLSRGSKNGNSKLNEEKVKEIKKRHIKGENTQLLASEFSVSSTTIRLIVNDKIWRHVS